jgi:hypothetical protein
VAGAVSTRKHKYKADIRVNISVREIVCVGEGCIEMARDEPSAGFYVTGGISLRCDKKLCTVDLT